MIAVLVCRRFLGVVDLLDASVRDAETPRY